MQVTLFSTTGLIHDDHLSGLSSLINLEKLCIGPFSDDFTGSGLSAISYLIKFHDNTLIESLSFDQV